MLNSNCDRNLFFKKNVIFFIGATMLALLGFGLYIFPHYAQDTYKIVRESSMSVSAFFSARTSAWLGQGRYSTGILWLLIKIIGMNSYVISIGGNAVSVLLVAVNISYVFSMFERYYFYDKTKLLSFGAIALIFLCPCFADWFQFAECAPFFLLGVLFCSIGVKLIYDQKTLKGIMALLIAVGFYQIVLSFFVLFYMSMLMLEAKKDIDAENPIKKYIKGAIKGILIYGFLAGSNILFTKIWAGGITRANSDLMQNALTVIKGQKAMWLMETTGATSYLYVGFFVLVVIIFFIQIIGLASKNKKYILYGVCAFISYIGIYMSVFISHIFVEPWLSQRTTVVFYGILSYWILLTIGLTSYNQKRRFALLLGGLVFVCGMVFIGRTNNLCIGLLKTNASDKLIAGIINEKIVEYEESQGVTIEYISFVDDGYRVWAYSDVFCMFDLNLRAWAVSWARNNMFYQYTGRDLIEVQCSQEIYDLVYQSKEWNYYEDEQIYFDGNTVYVGIY